MKNFNFLRMGLFCLLSMLAVSLSAQEICDNAIDDDGDGMIDLNDSDCACADIMASSLIPNPSFEEMSGCPQGEAQLDLADDWIQASEPTTDYLHTCGIIGPPFLFPTPEAPLPFPDGEGCIGFRDGKPGNANFKEYTGACLTGAMSIGTEYRLDFFIGFDDISAFTSANLAVFGSAECANLPFGVGDNTFGCPTNGPGWTQLGEMTVTGENEWKNIIFEFVADQAYEAIVIGPACELNPLFGDDPYFFFDRLVLAESVMFEVPLEDISGNICEDDLLLTSSDAMGGTYQWYKDGVALVGETNQSLGLTNVAGVEGSYEVVVTTATGCFNGQAYELVVPNYADTIEENFCEGGSIIIAGEEFDTAGTYDLQLTASDGCDSLVTLILSSTAIMNETLLFDECDGDEIVVNGETYTSAGTYTQNLTSVDGCDSILTIQYNAMASSSSQLSFEACDGEEVIVNGQSYTMTGDYIQQTNNSVGCDSIINISIVASATAAGSASFSICEGTGIDVNGVNYNEGGSYTQNLITTLGCDSMLTVNIIELATSASQESYEICDSEELVINGQAYNQAGTFIQGLTNAVGCDSILEISISMIASASSSLEFEVCDTDNITVNGEVYSAAGTYIQNQTAANGCDSIITIMVASSDVCSDCIFFEEFTAGTIEVTRIDAENFSVGLVQNDVRIINEIMNIDEFAQFTAFYLVDNEVEQEGNPSMMRSLINGEKEMSEVLSQCTWDKNQRFSKGEVVKALPYSSEVLPEAMNNKKLDLLYGNLIEQSAGLPVGAQMKIDLK